MKKAEIGTDIEKARELLRHEQLVAVPTETVYGLAGNALSEKAVAEIFAVKNRPAFDPLIIHVYPVERIGDWVTDFPEPARLLARAFMPGPLTLLLPKNPRIPDLTTSGSPVVAIRSPDHPLTQELLAGLEFPLAAPSANPFGYISPTTANHVARQLGDKIPYILDGGPCSVGIESTIIGWEVNGRPTLYRKGGIPAEEIEKVIGKITVQPHSTSNPLAPGMLKSHYAPRIPLVIGIIPELLDRYPAQRIGILSFRKTYPDIPAEHQVVLSQTGDLKEATRNLFSGLRHLDTQDIDLIIAEFLPESGLGAAINDRLRRAAATD